MRHKLPISAIVFSYVAVTGCTVHQSDPPALTGPSTFATSVTVTANPDLLVLGQSFSAPGQSSVVKIRVLDPTGQPMTNRPVRLDTLVNGVQEDCGQLQARNVTTDSSGQATTLFTAPGTPAPMPECTGFVPGGSVTIRATPVGTDAQSSSSNTASIRMVTSSFLTPVGGLSVNFSISANPKVSPAVVTFSDAGSASPGHSIVSFSWTFSDGASKSGSSVTHDFAAAGSYTATLTITDDIGQSAFKTVTFDVKP
jgi:hypothetical protein